MNDCAKADEGRAPNWGAEALWEQLVPLLPGLSVEVLARVESTNTRLLERARAVGGRSDAPVTRPGELLGLQGVAGRNGDERTPHGRRQGDVSPCLLVAVEQTRGRGRLGRDWHASAGASLTFSLALPLAPVQWAGLSLAVGLALAEALDPVPEGGVPRIGLKWPNDLWLMASPEDAPAARKLGGVLIETVSVGQHRMCVVGVGLNIWPQMAGWPGGGFPACLQQLDEQASAASTLARVAKPLVQALQRFEAEGFAPLAEAYARRDVLRGLAVSTTLPELASGVAEGVDEQGALCVRSGAVHRVVSGEVSVRLLAAGA